LAKQKEAPNSPYQVYKFLTAARKELPAVQKGKLITTALRDNILVLNRFTINLSAMSIGLDNYFFRVLDVAHDKNVLVVVNTGDDNDSVDVSTVETVPTDGEITFYTGSLDAEYTHA